MTRPYPEFPTRASGVRLPGFEPVAAQRRARDGVVHGRFVTESHALGAPSASPQAILLAVALAVTVFLIGRRLSA